MTILSQKSVRWGGLSPNSHWPPRLLCPLNFLWHWPWLRAVCGRFICTCKNSIHVHVEFICDWNKTLANMIYIGVLLCILGLKLNSINKHFLVLLPQVEEVQIVYYWRIRICIVLIGSETVRRLRVRWIMMGGINQGYWYLSQVGLEVYQMWSEW